MKKSFKYSLLLLLLLASCGRLIKPEVTKLPDKLKLEAISFSNLKGWQDDNISDLLPQLKSLCSTLKNTATTIDNVSYYWQNACFEIEKSNRSNLKSNLEKVLVPYLVVNEANNSAKGTFTGYYEAEIKAAFKQDSIYKYPVYTVPNDLFYLNLADFDSSYKNKTVSCRIKDKKITPYFSRSEIEKNYLDAEILMWADNPVDIFVAQIQGSAVAYIDDGRKIRIGYAGNNGHDFIGIGKIMTKRGVLESGKASMVDIKNWLESNPRLARDIMNENPRYIFFKKIESQSAIGAAGIPLVPERSLAVDPTFIPLKLPIWLETKDSYGEDINRLVFSYDTGNAIKGVVRGDFFWGSGETAFQKAAGMKSEGKYFLLLPR